MLTLSGANNEQHQEFFFSARIFEISRALIYTEPTFLPTLEWTMSIEQCWAQSTNVRTPKEALFDILPKFVDLGIHTLRFVTHTQSMSQQAQDQVSTSLAQEGLALQSFLLQWHLESTYWPSHDADGSVLDMEISIAYADYHTISVYLDGIFSYHATFTSVSAPISPILKRTEVDAKQILTTGQKLLTQGSAGVLLFFPLRVAGARARDASTQFGILRLLRMITQRGFAVAQSFVEDLTALRVRQQDNLEFAMHMADPRVVSLRDDRPGQIGIPRRHT
ncbi:hypothetical protein ST47_g10332 [Ascochyta rabiei]|uniref:Sequence-specific DNA binding RNA polymerase II transcription factor n=1 Tax=Didymella rabiei TaxID=5454 RepID=A0A162VP74_DIDRA|nr:hypothetical protein ST47_g10332 [Ascochyta rabiei]